MMLGNTVKECSASDIAYQEFFTPTHPTHNPHPFLAYNSALKMNRDTQPLTEAYVFHTCTVPINNTLDNPLGG